MNTSFGETLRNAREAKGLTTSQIAAKTRMLVQIVEEMENEDFHRIAAPIYGRGFVRLYAECVDLDPLPLVKEFMDIYEGRRAPIVRTRDVPVQAPPEPPPEHQPEPIPEPPPVVTPQLEPIKSATQIVVPQPEPIPEPPPVVMPKPEPIPEPPPVVAPKPEPIPEPPPVVAPKPEPIPEPPPVVAPKPEPIPEPPPVVAPKPEPIPEPPPVVRGLELFEAQAARQPQNGNLPAKPSNPSTASQPPATSVADIFSDSPYLATEYLKTEGTSAADRFKKSLTSVSHGVIQSVRDIPRSVWRISLLTIVAIILLAVLVWGCIKLYNATSIKPTQPPQAVDTTHEPNGPKEIKASKDVNGIKDSKDTKDLKASKDLKDLKKPKGTKPTAKPQPSSAKAAGKQPLRSTGQKVPPLYAD